MSTANPVVVVGAIPEPEPKPGRYHGELLAHITGVSAMPQRLRFSGEPVPYNDFLVMAAASVRGESWPWDRTDEPIFMLRAADFDALTYEPPGTRTVRVCDLHDDCKSDLRIAEACWLERAHKGGA